MQRFVAIIAGGLICLLAVAAIYINTFLPRTASPSDIEIVSTPELVERGRYLVEHLILCNDCHSERDWTLYGGPPMPPIGAGRACMTRQTEVAGIMTSEANFPGILCIRNITSDKETGIGDWTDGEIIRSMREGVGKDGRALFPIMPYFIFKDISDEDSAAIVAYMRALPPVHAERPQREIDFPMNVLIRLWPQPLTEPVLTPDRAETIAYGRYLSAIGRCSFCHTPRTGRGIAGIPGREFAGGVPFAIGARIMYSKNLTPHASGIGNWTREAFVARFKAYSEPLTVAPEDNTLMDWNAYAGMTEADLGAIYDYLQSLPPVEFVKQEL